MEGLIQQHREKRTQIKRLAEEMIEIERACETEFFQSKIRELQQQFPLLQNIVVTKITSDMSKFIITFTNGIVTEFNTSTLNSVVDITFKGECIILDRYAMMRDNFVYKNKIKATREAMNQVIPAHRAIWEAQYELRPDFVARIVKAKLEAE